MKKFIFIILLTVISVYPQKFKFGWVSNLAELRKNPQEISQLIDTINGIEDINFVIFTGKSADPKDPHRYSSLQKQLDKLSCSYFVSPDPNEIKNDGMLKFKEIWYDTDVYAHYGNKLFIGLTAENFLNDKKNIFTPESIARFKEEVSDTTADVFFVVEDDLINDFSNYPEILEPLQNMNSLTVLSPKTESKSDFRLNTVGFRKEADKFSFMIGEIYADTLELKQWRRDQEFTSFETIVLSKPEINPEFIQRESFKTNGEIFFHKDFNSTITAKPILNGDNFIVCTRTGIVTSLDTLGNTKWEFDSFGDIISTPVIADKKLIVATRQGDLLTVKAETGESLQTIGFDDYITSDLLAIEYSGDRQLFIEKQTDSETAIIFGTASGKIYCYDLETLQEYWSNNDSKHYIMSSIGIEDNRIIVQNSVGEIICIDAKRGWTIWKWNESSKKDKNIYQYQTVIYDGMLYVASTSGYVYGIDLLLGKTKWRSEKFRDCNAIALTPDKKNLLVKIYNEKLILVAKFNGTNLNVIRYDNGYDNAFATIFDNGENIFLTSNSGKIFKITNFKKSETTLEMPGKLFLDVLKVLPARCLITTVDGNIVFTNLE